jgi:hypothetical protein
MPGQVSSPTVSCGDILYPVQATDYDGAWIRWERRSYETHVRKRPDTADWHDPIGRVLADPELVVELPDGGTGYYRRGVLPQKYGGVYLYVVVRWNGALGDIATAFPTDVVKKFSRVVLMRK